MGAGVYAISLLVDWSDGGVTAPKMLVLLFAIAFGVTCYLMFARFFRSPEMVFLSDMILERWRKRENPRFN